MKTASQWIRHTMIDHISIKKYCSSHFLLNILHSLSWQYVFWLQMTCRSASIKSGLWAGQLGFNSWEGQQWDFFSPPLCADQLWSPLSLLSNGFQELSPWWYSGRGMKLTTHLHLVLRSRIHGAFPVYFLLLSFNHFARLNFKFI